MHLYFAGIDTVAAEHTYPTITNRLDTYAYPQVVKEYLRHAPARPRLMLDSGAFTAWNVGKSVNLDGYATWATTVRRDHRGRLAALHLINLDHIPGAAGRTATSAEVDAATQRSMENATHLRQMELPVMEVFHQQDPMPYLDTLMERLPAGEVLCISPANDQSVQARVTWLKRVLARLLASCSPATLPRTHGLAATAVTFLNAFPFYSADSSSWLAPLRYGATARTGLPHLPRTRHALAPTVLALRREIQHYHQLERDSTRLWERRGVAWTD